jgi:DNA-binding XRE family transcriptional regulator
MTRTATTAFHDEACNREAQPLPFRGVAGRLSTSPSQDIDRHVGARIRERRIKLGLTQRQFAVLIGVSHQQVHKYERGTNNISAGRLFEIAHVLSVPVNYFFDGIRWSPAGPLRPSMLSGMTK